MNPNPDTISSLFEERDRQPLQEDASPSSNALKKQVTPQLSLLEQSELPEPSKWEPENKAAKVDDQDILTPDFKTLQAELTKTNRRLAETQAYGHKNSKRLKSALKITRELVENGALSEAEAQSLVESLNNDDVEAGLGESSPYDTHPFGKVLKIANTELLSLRKYSDDELLDDKVKAFDHFLSLASPEEVKDALEELTDLIDDPIKLTKKMLSIGKLYYDEAYKDIANAGSVQNYIKEKHQEIDKLNKSIDKLTKKLAQYEDYDQPRHRISEVGESNDIPAGRRDPSSDLFHERDRQDVGRQKRLA
jgi:hypothetical protein